MRSSARWHPSVLVLLATLACGQVEPFTNPDFNEPGPLDPNPPVRLTWNPGPDVQPAFLQGGEIVFGFSRPGEVNEDQCLGALPNQGGTTLAESCPRTPGSRDSTERYGEARPLTADTVVLLYARRLEGRRLDDNAWIGRAPWRSATEFTARLQFPFRSTSGQIQFTPTHLSLTGPTRVAYLATGEVRACPGLEPVCESSEQELITVGIEAGEVDLANDEPPVVLSGTTYATSIAAGRTTGSALFTLPGDLTVYERSAAGAVTALTTLPGTSAVRDPTLAGSRLVSVVDGAVSLYTLADGALVQVSGGGDLVLTDLLTGGSTVIASGGWTRPSLSPDGRQLVAVRGSDIYRFDLP